MKKKEIKRRIRNMQHVQKREGGWDEAGKYMENKLYFDVLIAITKCSNPWRGQELAREALKAGDNWMVGSWHT